MNKISNIWYTSEQWKRQLFLSIFMVLLFVITLVHFQNMNNPERVVNRIQQTVLEQQKILQQSIDQVSEIFFHTEDNIFLDASIAEIIKSKQVLIYLFQNDSLVYWSDNKLGEEQINKVIDQGDDFIELVNGYYLSHVSTRDESCIVALSPIKSQYPYENAFLQNELAPAYNISVEVALFKDPDQGLVPIMNLNEEAIFSVTVGDDINLELNQLLLLLVLLIIAQSFVYALVCSLHFKMGSFIKSPTLQFIFLALDLLIIRAIQRFFELPAVLYDSPLFSATFYSSGFIFANFGELILNVLTFLFIAIHFYRLFHNSLATISKSIQLIKIFIISIVLNVLYIFYIQTVESLLFHSAIPLSFAELYQLNTLSYLSFLVLSSITLAFYLVARVILVNIVRCKQIQALGILLFLVSIWIVWWMAGSFIITGYLVLILPVLLFAHEWFINRTKTIGDVFNQFIWPLLIFSLLLTFVFYQVNHRKGDQKLQLMAFNLGIESDPVFEFLYFSSQPAIQQDTLFQNILYDHVLNVEEGEVNLKDYLTDNYLKGYFDRFNINLTICDNDEVLNIQPENYLVNCMEYFDDLLNAFGEETETAGLFLIRDNLQGTYYLSRMDFALNKSDITTDTVSVFLEFYSKFIPEGLGYPELLVDERHGIGQDLSKYSFARYSDGILVYKFGNYMYPTKLNDTGSEPLSFFNLNGFRHLSYPVNDDFSLIVSRKSKSIIDILAPFTYFFIFIGLLGILVFVLAFRQLFFQQGSINFKLRLQMLIVGSLLFSFVVIGTSSTLYIQNIYQQKNNAILTEKTQSILIEIEHKLKDENIHTHAMEGYLHQLLVKFSMVFYADINLYDVNGMLLASSRPEIFERGLVSGLMNPKAYRQMHHAGALFYLQKEQIGSATYLSSYIPFADSYGQTVAYINLPYFARESELREELSAFVLTYVNIFFLLTGLSVILALLLSRQLTRPLSMIQEKMRSVKFNSINEKISWKARDEIGQLIDQYNHMIDELEKSAELLTRSERESAWREMARQVAHEIKNPLTPMRLSIQHLLRAWQEQDPDIENKIKRTTQTLVEQIDTLSEIASAFSDFAKMPRSRPEEVNLEEIIQKTIRLYSGMQHARFTFENHIQEIPTIYADQKNLNRVFNNLFKNAIQAVEKGEQAHIRVVLSSLIDNYRITVTDNGRGMTPEQAQKVFTPYFTTKSSGMGIGLSIVYNIITSAGGTISFETELGKGTTFTILLPTYEKSKDLTQSE